MESKNPAGQTEKSVSNLSFSMVNYGDDPLNTILRKPNIIPSKLSVR